MSHYLLTCSANQVFIKLVLSQTLVHFLQSPLLPPLPPCPSPVSPT